MCGIAGIFAPEIPAALLIPPAEAMTAALAHRGPDGHGMWADDCIVLGHRRLAVLDISPAGAQPMTSADGRFALILNGEIYNHCELRRALPDYPWRGHSDSESLLAAFAAWGVEKTLKQIRGMFAGAFWEKGPRRLWIFRDRLGEKPLYYGRYPIDGGAAPLHGAFIFASELKALRTLPGFIPTIRRTALAQLIERSFCRDCIWEGISKLMPGCFCCLTAADIAAGKIPAPSAYWSLTETARKGAAAPFRGTDTEAADVLEDLLQASVKEQAVADVPLGVMLSGGIDSSLLTAIMAQGGPVTTFSIGIPETDFDEAPAAATIAKHLGTSHHTEYLCAKQALSLVKKLPQIYDEPFADSSQIPTYFVCKTARANVTVALGGDGGDENFGGYERYLSGDLFWSWWLRLPSILRRIAAAGGSVFPPVLGNRLSSLWPSRHPRRWGDKFARLMRGATADDFAEFYAEITASGAANNNIKIVVDDDKTCPDSAGTAALYREITATIRDNGYSREAMLLDIADYLPNDLLVKSDRAAMSLGLEIRAPLLDPRIVDFSLTLPAEMKFRRTRGGFTNKWLLREVARRYLPDNLLQRQKKGFSIPLGSWLRGEFREWAGDLLSPAYMQKIGFFNVPAVARLWGEHLAGRHDHAAVLWNILMFAAWQQEQ